MLALASLISLLATPAAPAPTYVACDYYDFLHDVTYRSRLFTPANPVSPNGHDVPALTAPFGLAIKAAYGLTPDPKHLECLIIGAVSLKDAQAKDADPKLWDASEHKVDWPPSD